MEYRRAFGYLFSKPNWIQTVLLLTVCALIPVVGVLVLLGYRSEQLDDWLDEGTDDKVRPFDFNRFADLLMRGVWPFLYGLIIGLAFAFILILMYVLVFISIFAFARKNPEMLFLIFGFFYLFIFVVQVFAHFISWPFILYGQVSGKFDFGAAWSFSKDFYSKNGLSNLLMISLVCMIINVILMIVGVFVFCLGYYVAMAVIVMADGHILWQLYRRHLERGGSSIPRFEKPKPRSRDEDNRPVEE